MAQKIAVAALVLAVAGALAQTPAARPAFDQFEVATVKPVDADLKAGRMFKFADRPRVGCETVEGCDPRT